MEAPAWKRSTLVRIRISRSFIRAMKPCELPPAAAHTNLCCTEPDLSNAVAPGTKAAAGDPGAQANLSFSPDYRIWILRLHLQFAALKVNRDY